MTEIELVAWCIEYLLRKRHFVWRNNTGAQRWEDKSGRTRMFRFGKKGSADIIGAHGESGLIIAIECKRPGMQPTPEQVEFLENIRRTGGYAAVVHSPEEMMAVL